MTDHDAAYELRVTAPAQRQLGRLPEGTAAAIVEFMLGALVDNPHRVGGRLQRELAGLHSARRGAYRVVYEIDEDQRAVIVIRIDEIYSQCGRAILRARLWTSGDESAGLPSVGEILAAMTGDEIDGRDYHARWADRAASTMW